MMSSPRSKGQRKKPKCVPESAAMQSEVEGFKDVVYAELFSEATSPARNGAKKAKPGPLSRKLRLDKKKPVAVAQPEASAAETNGAQDTETNGTYETDTNGTHDAETNDTHIAETNGSHAAETNGTAAVDIQELQVPEPRVQEPAAPTEFLPAELFEPSAQESFPEYLPETSALDDSFASTEIFTADQSASVVEVCVSPSAFPLDESRALALEETAPLEAEPEQGRSEPAPEEATAPAPTARPLRETPRDYRGFLSVSSRPSIRDSTPTASTPQSFLRCREDPATPFVWGKRKAEDADAEREGAKRVKAAEGFFARVTAPLYRAFSAKEIDEDEGIEAGVEVVEPGQPKKYCVVM